MQKQKTVSLVLGSGGARGFAHIGVIHWLEAHGYRIASISGCSMGALVGGIYAAGKLEEYTDWVRTISKTDIVSLLDVAWGQQGGLVKGNKIIQRMVDLVGDHRIEDLPIPFTAVASDVVREKEIWLQKGRLFDAIRASISIPFMFVPFEYKGMKLVDGGVTNPVPMAPTLGEHTDLTIAVNLGGAREDLDKFRQGWLPKKRSEGNGWGRTLAQVQESLIAGLLPSDWQAYEMAHRSFDTMQNALARHVLAVYPPDVLIDIPRNACSILEFDRADELIALGELKADQAMRAARFK